MRYKMSNLSEKRTPNFSPSEKIRLFNIVKAYAHILEDKKTTKINVIKKNKVWEKIEEKFNNKGPILCYRTSSQLKTLYENSKKCLRKKLAERRKQLFLTRSGGSPPNLESNPIDELILQNVNKKNVTGFHNPFDSDSAILTLPKNRKSEAAAQLDDDDDVIEFEFSADEIPRGLNMILDDIEGESTQEKSFKEQHPDELQVHEKTLLDGQHTVPSNITLSENTTSLHEENRSRPQNSALASSEVSEKYNKLLGLRLVLIKKQIRQATELQNLSIAEQKKKIDILKQQEDILVLEKEEKKLKVELLKLEVAYKKKHMFMNL